jgi:hypothetical protein
VIAATRTARRALVVALVIQAGAIAIATAQPASQAPASAALRVEIDPAPPVCLYADRQARSDSNTAVVRVGGRAYAFPSHWDPIGHSVRRVTDFRLAFADRGQKVVITDDRDPTIGKWLESVWVDPSGRLYGWYHAEVPAPCEADLRIPHIGALVSDDGGASWRSLGVVLRAPRGSHDCHAENGFVAGGYGDFSVVADRAGAFFYIFFSSYVGDETAQGIAVARYPIADRDRPGDATTIWRDGTWQPARGTLPTPLWPQAHGWRHRNAIAFWGPAVHDNRDLRAFVMLLNHTRDGEADWRQDGIYASINADPAHPDAWGAPQRIIDGGFWYPEVVGLGPKDGDARAGSTARFFMGGYSEWFISFDLGASGRRRAVAAPRGPVTLDIRGAAGWPDPWSRRFRRAGPTAPGPSLAPACRFGD